MVEDTEEMDCLFQIFMLTIGSFIPFYYKGLDHNFTMFFQLKLVKIAQTPLPP